MNAFSDLSRPVQSPSERERRSWRSSRGCRCDYKRPGNRTHDGADKGRHARAHSSNHRRPIRTESQPAPQRHCWTRPHQGGQGQKRIEMFSCYSGPSSEHSTPGRELSSHLFVLVLEVNRVRWRLPPLQNLNTISDVSPSVTSLTGAEADVRVTPSSKSGRGIW